MDLATSYLDLRLRNPLIASASPLTGELGALRRLEEPLTLLRDRFAARLEDEAEELEVGDRIRLEAMCR